MSIWEEFPFRRRRRPFSFFGGFFEEIDEMMREMEEMFQREFSDISRRIPRDLIRERKLPDGSTVKEWGPFVYGYSITIGPDGRPQIREFGNVKPGLRPGRYDFREEREPLVDIFETDGEVKVVAELPGVDKNDIKLHATEDTLTISVDTPERKYHKELDLPAKINPEGAKTSYKNGVLEVTLPKISKEKPKGKPIKIE